MDEENLYAAPQANLEKSRGRPALSRAPLVRAYVTRSGSRLSHLLHWKISYGSF